MYMVFLYFVVSLLVKNSLPIKLFGMDTGQLNSPMENRGATYFHQPETALAQ